MFNKLLHMKANDKRHTVPYYESDDVTVYDDLL